MGRQLFIIKPHSVIDVITNSSTEIFVIDNNSTINAVQKIVDAYQDKHPNEYGHRFEVHTLDEYQAQEFIPDLWIPIEKAIKYLELQGYSVEKQDIPKYLGISAERGGHEQIDEYIREIFNVVDYCSEA